MPASVAGPHGNKYLLPLSAFVCVWSRTSSATECEPVLTYSAVFPFALWCFHLPLKESFIQRPSLCWWVSADQTLHHVCGCWCGQKALEPAIHHQILIRFHHSASADIWFIALGALFESLKVNKGSWVNVSVVLVWGASLTCGKLVRNNGTGWDR